MVMGIVKFFNEKKGWGFISPEDGKEDIFVHFSGVIGEGFKTLTEQDKVSFDVEKTEKGFKAVNVKKIA